jgi:hypothetical protein
MSGNPARLSGLTAVAFSVVTLTAWQASSGTPDVKSMLEKPAGQTRSPCALLHHFLPPAYRLPPPASRCVNHIAQTYARSAKRVLERRDARS